MSGLLRPYGKIVVGIVLRRLGGASPELRAIWRLRRLGYANAGIELPPDAGGEHYADPDDPVATHIVAEHPEAGIIGAFKITPRRRAPMMLERYVDTEVLGLPPGEVAELSRLVVHPERQNLGLSLPLWQQAYRELVRTGIGDVYSIMRPGPLAGLASIGMPVHHLTEPFVAQRVSVRLTRIHIPDVGPALERARPAIAAFFARELPDGVYHGPRSVLGAARLTRDHGD